MIKKIKFLKLFLKNKNNIINNLKKKIMRINVIKS